jgi:hypothetical protein
MRAFLALFLAAATSLAFGCATHHTVEPYRSDPDAARALEARAERTCAAMEPRAGIPERPFVTDGCTAYPDGRKASCCIDHDIPYWCGGTRDQRRQADADLASCVADTGSPVQGRLMSWGVRVSGHPFVSAGWRWGFGHAYPAGYAKPVDGESTEP